MIHIVSCVDSLIKHMSKIETNDLTQTTIFIGIYIFKYSGKHVN